MPASATAPISSPTLISWVFPLMLLTSALLRLTLPSFFYLLSFFVFLLWSPIRIIPRDDEAELEQQAQQHDDDNASKRVGYWYSRTFFIVQAVVSGALLLSQLIATIVVHARPEDYTDAMRLCGLTPLGNDPLDTVQSVAPDAVMCIGSVLTLVLLQRHTRDSFLLTVSAVDLRRLLWDCLSFLSLLFAGVLYISLVSLPYFVLFLALLLYLTFHSYDDATRTHVYRNRLIAFMPHHERQILNTLLFYLPCHVALLYIYQFTAVDHLVFDPNWGYSGRRDQWPVVDLLGLWTPLPSRLFTPPTAAYFGSITHIVFLFCLGERRERWRQADESGESRVAHAEEHEKIADELAVQESESEDIESVQPSGPSDDLKQWLMANGDPAAPSVVVAAAAAVREPRSVASQQSAVSPRSHASSIRHFFLRSSRYFGRFFCSLLLFTTIFTLPSLLSVLLLVMLISSMLTTSQHFTRLAPYYLFFLLFAAFVLYVFSIPSLITTTRDREADESEACQADTGSAESLSIIELIGLLHTHQPFLYVLDLIAPSLFFAAYLICYRLSLASLNEESTIIAVIAGDEVMVNAAMRQSPPTLITHTKDQRGRTLLHLACRYGALSLVLPLCRFLNVNAQDREGKTALHYAYYHGYDRIVRALLFHPLIDTNIRDKHGERALEQERSLWVRIQVVLSETWEWLTDMFINNADRISLVLLYVVATSATDGLHLIFFLFFLLFFTFPTLAARHWAVLVVYSSMVLTALFSYSVLYEAVCNDFGDETRQWLHIVGLFNTDNYFVDLALYYCLVLVVIMQWNIFERKEQREIERRTQQQRRSSLRGVNVASSGYQSPSFPPSNSASFIRRADDEKDDEEQFSLHLPLLRLGAAILASLALLMTALLPPPSLFHLGYLLLFMLSLLLPAFFPDRHRLHLAFYLLCSTYSLTIITLEYCYLCGGFRGLAASWRTFEASLGASIDSATIGFVASSDSNIVLAMLPFTVVFVTQVIQLRVHVAYIRSSSEEIEAHQEGRAINHQHLPLSPRSPASVAIDIQIPVRHRSSRSVALSTFSSPMHSRSASSGFNTPWSARKRRRWSLAVEEALSQHDRNEPATLLLFLTFVYATVVDLLRFHAHHLLAAVLILDITLQDSVSIASCVFLLFLLTLLPVHQGSYLFGPVILYAPLLIAAKFIYQLPPVIEWSHNGATWLEWFGLADYHTQLVQRLWGDLLVLFIAALQHIVASKDEPSDSSEELPAAVDIGNNLLQPLMNTQQQRNDSPLQASFVRTLPATSAALGLERLQEAKRSSSAPSGSATASINPTDHTTNLQVSPAAATAAPLPDQPELAASHSAPHEHHEQAELLGLDHSWTLNEVWLFLRALLVNLALRFSQFLLAFLSHYSLQLSLLFVLLTACYRNNAMSLVYLVLIVIYITHGRAGTKRVWLFYLVLTGLSIAWQFIVVLIQSAPITAITLPFNNRSALQNWLLVGSISPTSISFDMLTYLVLCVHLPYVFQLSKQRESDERQQEHRRRRWAILGDDVVTDTAPGTDTIIRSEEKFERWKAQEGAEVVHGADDSNGAEYALPASHSSVGPRYSFESFSLHKRMERRAALIWPTMAFYLTAWMDKLFFLFIFAAATAHIDLLSLPFLFFSLWILISNHLYTGNRAAFTRQYKALQYYTVFVLLIALVYQFPLIPCPTADSSPDLHWERMIGLRKYRGCDNAVDALSMAGALGPLLVFFLIDAQILVLQSAFYDSVERFFAESRSLASIRASHSLQHTQEQNKQRILRILALRDSITASFTKIFLLANQLSADYFEDETVWSSPKPLDWDLQVARDLREQEANKHRSQGDSKSIEDDSDPLPSPSLVHDYASQIEKAFMPDPLPPKDSRDVSASEQRALEEEKRRLAESQSNTQNPSEPSGTSVWAKSHHWLRLYLSQHIDATLYAKYQSQTQNQATSVTPTRIETAPTPMSITVAMPSEAIARSPRDKDAVPSSSEIQLLSTVTLLHRFVVTQSQYVVFLAFFLALLIHPDALSVVVPLAIVCYAIFEFPRAPALFFLAAFAYTFLLIALKFVFQLEVFCVRADPRKYILAPSPVCVETTANSDPTLYNQFDYLLGLTKTAQFFASVLPELLCLLTIVWHREVSLERGVWHSRSVSEVELVHPSVIKLLENYEAQQTQRQRASSESEDESRPLLIPQPNVHANNRIKGKWRAVKSKVQTVLDRLPASIHRYYRSLSPQSRLHGININKPGSDFFLLLFFLELISAAMILFDWDNLAATTSTAGVSSFQTSMFSAQMVLILFIQIVIIVLERVIFNFRSIFAKVALQYFAAVFWLTQILLVWPVWSQTGVSASHSLQFFLFLKLMYLFVSGMQIYAGFPPVELTGEKSFTRHPGIYTVKLYQIYRAIPFVFELRTILDWMCTMSALDLDETFKLEDIYTRLYLVQCALFHRRQHRRGDSRPWDEKLLNGVLLFVLLLSIIFAPLVLFSSANPVTDRNPVTGVTMSLSVIGPRGEWQLFETSSLNDNSDINDAVYAEMRQARLIDSNDNEGDIQTLTLANFSDSFWAISPPALRALVNQLQTNDTFQARLTLTFDRSQSQSASALQDIEWNSNQYELVGEPRRQLAEMIETSNERNNLTLPELVPQFFRLPAAAQPIDLLQDQPQNRSDLVLVLVNEANQTHPQPYFMAFAAVTADNITTIQDVSFTTISNRVFSGVLSQLSFSIVSLYSLILFTFGQFIRLLFSNLVAKIPYDDIQNADRLIALVEAIYVARWKKELRMEEILYRRLIKILRTGPLLIELTKREDDGQRDRYAGESDRAKEEEDQETEREADRYLHHHQDSSDSDEDSDSKTVGGSGADDGDVDVAADGDDQKNSSSDPPSSTLRHRSRGPAPASASLRT